MDWFQLWYFPRFEIVVPQAHMFFMDQRSTIGKYYISIIAAGLFDTIAMCAFRLFILILNRPQNSFANTCSVSHGFKVLGLAAIYFRLDSSVYHFMKFDSNGAISRSFTHFIHFCCLVLRRIFSQIWIFSEEVFGT